MALLIMAVSIAGCQNARRIPVILDTDIGGIDPEKQSSCLFDTVAVYLAFSNDLCGVRDLSIKVTDQGVTEPDPAGKPMHVAMTWKDLDAFHELVARRIARAR